MLSEFIACALRVFVDTNRRTIQIERRNSDRRLDELGLRPIFRGGTRIPRSERPTMRTRYQELRDLIDELRTAAAEGHPGNPAYRLALLTGYTDQHYGDEGGTLWPDSRHFAKRASWYLLRGLAWGRLPYLAIEDAVQRYGYKLGRRLDRLSPQLRGRFAPETADPDRAAAVDDWAA